MLIRTSKDKEHPYVILNKMFLHDKKLSLKAKGLLSYCMCQRDDWQFHIAQLASILKEGERAIKSAFRELIRLGYCKRVQNREKGEFKEIEYILFETQQLVTEGDLKKLSRKKQQSSEVLNVPTEPQARNALAGNSTAVSNEESLYTPIRNVDNNIVVSEQVRTPPLPLDSIKEELEKLGLENNLLHNIMTIISAQKEKLTLLTEIFPDIMTTNTTSPNSNNNKKQEKIPIKELPLAEHLFQELKKINPKIRKPNLDKWAVELQRMMHQDERSEEEIRQVIQFLVHEHCNPKKDFTWSLAVISPQKLRHHFASIWMEMKKISPSEAKKQVEEEKMNEAVENQRWTREKLPEWNEKITVPHIRLATCDTYMRIVNPKERVDVIILYNIKGYKEVVIKNLKQAKIL